MTEPKKTAERKKVTINLAGAEDKVLTIKMARNAKVIAADRQKSIALLKQAGILDDQEHLAKEYAN